MNKTANAPPPRPVLTLIDVIEFLQEVWCNHESVDPLKKKKKKDDNDSLGGINHIVLLLLQNNYVINTISTAVHVSVN